MSSFLYESGYETKHIAGGDTHRCVLEEQCKQTNPKAVIKNLPPVDFSFTAGLAVGSLSSTISYSPSVQ